MTTAIAVRADFYQSNSVITRWQNFWMQATVDGYAPKGFQTSEILLNRSADEGGITMQLPATADDISFFLTAIENEYLVDVRLYEQEVTGSMPTSFNTMTMVGRFVGEVQTMQMSITDLNVSIGAALDAINGDIPGRRITTSLVGRLPSL